MKYLVAELAVITVVSVVLAPVAYAQAKPDLARGQQIATTVCVACHGADGHSPVPANPHLAGQGEQYIASQLAAFKSGKEEGGRLRVNPIMAGMAAGLSPDDMKAVGAFFSSQKMTRPAVASNRKLAEEGQKIYRAGIKKIDVPACAGCHAATGAGVPAQYPRLAGQWPEYTLQSLLDFTGNQRKHPVMTAIAKRMNEGQMKAVAEYAAGMR